MAQTRLLSRTLSSEFPDIEGAKPGLCYLPTEVRMLTGDPRTRRMRGDAIDPSKSRTAKATPTRGPSPEMW